jgi:hypothetical protein
LLGKGRVEVSCGAVGSQGVLVLPPIFATAADGARLDGQAVVRVVVSKRVVLEPVNDLLGAVAEFVLKAKVALELCRHRSLSGLDLRT